ncbi:TRAP transporter small permease subunit [Ekhidna sp.]|uniref:TRAP transporter small permease subunit n=1 Tax=Ekhidna sp. TaxID=2608089 RepID=UPI003B59C8A7
MSFILQRYKDGYGSFTIFVDVTLIDNLNKTIGKAISWLTLLLVLIIVVDVILRYTFSITSAASFELEWHLFAAIFLLGAAYTLKEDKHVRVDVFYHRFSPKSKAWVNLIGTLLLLMPFCAVAFWESLSFVQSSFSMNETSPQPGGLPARWIIKSTIPVGFLLLALQGISLIIQSIKTITHGGQENQ